MPKCATVQWDWLIDRFRGIMWYSIVSFFPQGILARVDVGLEAKENHEAFGELKRLCERFVQKDSIVEI